MKIVFMYSGQGAQAPGMMKDIYDKYEESRKIFKCAEDTLGRSISELSFKGTADDLTLTHNTQPCVLAADLAAGAALEANGIHPDAVAGFSLGEYGALVRANVITLEDAFSVIQIRADAMQEAVPVGVGAMAAIMGAADTEVEELCNQVNGYVVPANYNSPVQTVISGTAEAVDNALQIASEKGIKGVKLAVSAPFHCGLMKPAAEMIKTEFEGMTFSNPSIPVYMNVDSEILKTGEDAKELLYRQAMSAVLWKQTLLRMFDDGIDTFIECGPGKTLWGLARKTLPKDAKILRVADLVSLEKTVATLTDE